MGSFRAIAYWDEKKHILGLLDKLSNHAKTLKVNKERNNRRLKYLG